MVINTSLGKRLSLLATACLLSVALPAQAAWAQKVKDKGTTQSSASETSTTYDVEIPEIDSVDSNVDDEIIRAIFSGALVENADALAGLTATSITIPEITLSITTTTDGDTKSGVVTFSDIVLSDVTDGAAASFSLASTTLDAGEDGSGDYGSMSAANVDIAALLGMYGLVTADDSTELQTIYSDFVFEGGTFEADDVSCTMGSMTAPELKARPLKTSFVEIFALVETLEDGNDPSPKQIGDLLRMYADFFTAFESAPITFDGFSCEGLDSDDKPLSFSIASMSMDGMRPGVYPAISMDGFNIAVEGDGLITLANATIKEMDLSGPIAAVLGAPEGIDEAWLTANAQQLVPAFTGFSLSDLVIDIPDMETDGERINVAIGAYDLTLGNYFNGIPTDLNTSASKIVVDLPQDSGDPQLQQLIDLGLTTIDAGFVVDASWSEAEDTITIDQFSVSGVDLGVAAVSGKIINATEDLFSWDEDLSMMAAMGMALANLKVEVKDEGISDLVLATVAAEQGSNAETMRPIFAGLAEGTVIGILAGAAEAQKVGGAVSSFVSGKAKNLTIEMTAREPAGLGMVDFMMAEDDPTVLLGKVTIDATAK